MKPPSAQELAAIRKAFDIVRACTAGPSPWLLASRLSLHARLSWVLSAGTRRYDEAD